MYRAPSKRRQLTQRVFVYSFMTMAIVLGVTALVLVMLGYRFNRETSSIQQGGLVQFATRPTDASVSIGSAKLTDTTPSKITVNPGTYDVTMNRSGYKSWQKNVNVRAGEVLWLNYAQLIPNEIQTDTSLQLPAVKQVKSSPNGRYMALLTARDKPMVNFVDVGDETPKQTTLTLPSAVLPEGKVTYRLQDWNDDSNHFLMTATQGKRTDWLLVERDGTAKDVVNLSSTYDDSITEVSFDPRSSGRLIIRTDANDLRYIDTASESLSSIVATNVSGLTFYGNDALFFVRQVEKGIQSIEYVSLGDDKPRELKRIQSDAPVKVAAASYFGDPYITIAVGVNVETYQIDSLPSSNSDAAISMNTVATRALPNAPTYLSIRSGGRFVVMQYAGGVATYDIELTKQTLMSVPSAAKEELRWLDRYHFYVTNGKQLTVMEFDGGNQQTIVGLSTTFDAVQTDDGKYIYTIDKDGTKAFELQRSQIILD